MHLTLCMGLCVCARLFTSMWVCRWVCVQVCSHQSVCVYTCIQPYILDDQYHKITCTTRNTHGIAAHCHGGADRAMCEIAISLSPGLGRQQGLPLDRRASAHDQYHQPTSPVNRLRPEDGYPCLVLKCALYSPTVPHRKTLARRAPMFVGELTRDGQHWTCMANSSGFCFIVILCLDAEARDGWDY